MPYLIITIELIIIILLIIYNLKIRKKSAEVKTTILKIKELTVTKDILNIISDKKSYKEKFEDINKYILDTLKIDYSSIVLKEGESLEILSTNADKNRLDEIPKYYLNKIFAPALYKGESVYFKATLSEEEYKNIKTNIKSAIFMPIMIDNVFSGFWILESNNENDLDKIDLKILKIIKENLSEVIRVTSYQSAFETLTKEDEFSSFNTREYLFGELKNELDKFEKSFVLMLDIKNLKNINKKYGRDIGNKTIIEISNIIKNNIPENAEAVRYFGPKLVIVYKNIFTKEKTDSQIIEDLKIKELMERIRSVELKKNFIFKVKPEVNFSYVIYEKNTRLHKQTEKMSEYLDSLNELKENLQKI